MTTVTLTKPIAIGPALYSELTYRKPLFGDLPLMMKMGTLEDLDDVVRLVARLADVPLEVACQIDPQDIAPVLNSLTSHIAGYMPATD